MFSGTVSSAEEVRELAALGVSGYINEYSAAQHILPSLAPHLFPDNFNRRGSPRLVLGIPIAYRSGGTIAAALTLNINRGGMAIRTTSPLERDTEVKLRFRLPGSKKDIDLDARVCVPATRPGGEAEAHVLLRSRRRVGRARSGRAAICRRDRGRS